MPKDGPILPRMAADGISAYYARQLDVQANGVNDRPTGQSWGSVIVQRLKRLQKQCCVMLSCTVLRLLCRKVAKVSVQGVIQPHLQAYLNTSCLFRPSKVEVSSDCIATLNRFQATGPVVPDVSRDGDPRSQV
jgi:hypothetical protein